MLAALVFLAAAAETPDAMMAAYHDATRVDRPCREAAARGEIIVCARRGSVYRLPFRAPEPGSRAARAANVPAERETLRGRAVDAGGIMSCSTVGPGGSTGCTKGIDLVSPAKTVLRAVDIID